MSTALRQCSREAKTHPHLIFLAQDQVTELCRGVAYSGHAAPGGRHEFIRELRAESVLAPEMAAIVARTEHPLLQAETLAMELEPQGIGVSVLCPGWVATHITESQRN